MCALLCMRIKHLKCQTTATGMFSQMLPLPRRWISTVFLIGTKTTCSSAWKYLQTMEVNPPADLRLLFYIISLRCSKSSSKDLGMRSGSVLCLAEPLSTCVSASDIDFLFLLFSQEYAGVTSTDSKHNMSYSCSAFWYILSNCGCRDPHVHLFSNGFLSGRRWNVGAKWLFSKW